MPGSKAKWAWALAGINLLYACFFVFVLMASLLIISALADLEGGWPYFILIAIGYGLSIGATYLGYKAKPKWYFIAYLANGMASLIYAIPLVFILYLFSVSIKQKIILDNKYMGNVTIVEGVSTGERIKYEGKTQVIRIPSSGVLLLADSLTRGITRRKFFYGDAKGTLTPIEAIWNSSLHPTQEDLADTLTVGIYKQTSGSFSGTGMECMYANESFYVGTKPWLLRNYEERDMGAYLDSAGVKCKK